MEKKERYAAVASTVTLYFLAGIFSLALFLRLLISANGNSNPLWSLGNMFFTAYGFSSVVIPVFFFTAASFSMSPKWSFEKAYILVMGLLPFFTLSVAERISRSIAGAGMSFSGFFKIIALELGSLVLVCAEFVAILVFAAHSDAVKKDPARKNDSFFEIFSVQNVKAGFRKLCDFLKRFKNFSLGLVKPSIDRILGREEKSAGKPNAVKHSVKHPAKPENDENLENDEIPREPEEKNEVPEERKIVYNWSLDAKGNRIPKDDGIPSDGENVSQGEEFVPQAVYEPSEAVFETEDEEEVPQENSFSPETMDYDMEFEDDSQEEMSDEDILEKSFADYERNLAAYDPDDEENVSRDEFDVSQNDDEPFGEDSVPSENVSQRYDDVSREYERFLKESPLFDRNQSPADGGDLTQDSTKSMNSALCNVFSRMEDDARRVVMENSDVQDEIIGKQAEIRPEIRSEQPETTVPQEKETDARETFAEKPNVPQPAAVVTDERGVTRPVEITPKKIPNYRNYSIPTELLVTYEENRYWEIDDETKQGAQVLKNTLKEFKIDAEITGITKGPVVTMFEMLPAPGIKLSKIISLADNIALRLAAASVRIVAPIPGKRAVGIEVPNKNRAIVSFRECIEKEMPEWKKMSVPVVLGKDIQGDTKLMDLVKTPHLLIAGSTGAGKSVCVNSMILSILYKRTPQEVKLILIDPKIVELKLYNGIPHLLTPVITEPKKAMQALQYALCEMERRYAVLDGMGCREITSYNRKIVEKNICAEKLPYMVIIIDEFADLMATTGKQLEQVISRLAAMSRAVGIHLVLATQRPSIDVITGLIKANIPTRIAFMVASKTDSRIILDNGGADKLLGRGDMLYASAVDPVPMRIQGAFISDQEVENVVEAVKEWGEPEYIDDEIFVDDEEDEGEQASLFGDSGVDPLYEKALDIVIQSGKASASYIQRRLSIGYNRAARLIEEMEERGIVGPANGSKPREIIHMP